jgi:glycosyltransferase involved in cell wall biosynthesis
MIRICMITHDQIERNAPGADLIRFRCLGESLRKHSFEVVYIACNERGRYEESLYQGSKIYKVPFVSRVRMIQLLCFYALLIRFLFRVRSHGPFHIVFVNSILTVPSALMLRRVSGKGRIQFDLMGILSEEKFLHLPGKPWFTTAKRAFSFLEDFLLSRVDFITTINDQHREILLKRVRRPVYVVRDAVFEAVLRRPEPIPDDPPIHSNVTLIFVGQVNHFRLDPLIKILPDLAEKIPNLRLQVVGSGPQLEHCRSQVESLGLKNRVSFCGHVPHATVFDHIAKTDIAFSDDWSVIGFPMKLFDYMAAGKAIVAEGTKSVKEILTDGVNGLLYTDEGELKEKILTLARDAALRKRLGEAARRVMDEHTWEKRVEALGAIYRQVVPEPGEA